MKTKQSAKTKKRSPRSRATIEGRSACAAQCSADSLLAEKIAELEAEVARLRKVARVGREPRKGFGGTIQRLREIQGLGPRQLGEKSGCGGCIVTQLETRDDANVTLRVLCKLAGGLGLRPSELVAEYEKENPQNDPSSATPGETYGRK